MNAEGEKKLEATAYHEAGHAVVCHLLGIGVRKISIVPEGDTLGYVLRKSGRYYYADMIYGALAGPIAGGLHTGKEDWESGAHDLQRALYYSHQDNDEDWEIAIAELLPTICHVRTYMREPERWAAIKALAAALLEVREMEPSQIRSVIKQAMANAKKMPPSVPCQSTIALKPEEEKAIGLRPTTEEIKAVLDLIPAICRDAHWCAVIAGNLMPSLRLPLLVMGLLLYHRTCPAFEAYHAILGERSWYEKIQAETEKAPSNDEESPFSRLLAALKGFLSRFIDF